jgi:hypothetical protein
MSVCAKTVLLGFSLCLAGGCSHFVETRTITRFAEAMQQNDLDGVKSRSSEHFEKKALRLADSLDDFKILRIPDGKVSVVKVQDVSKDQKHVTVQIGDSKQELLYKLTRNDESGDWVIDDIYMQQKQKGLTARKSVTEQMDLLLTVREFLAAWDRGGRDSVLSIATPDFARLLGDLPPIYLAQLTKRVVGERSARTRVRPEAHMDEGVAIVKLPRMAGELVIKLEMLEDRWKVADVSLEARSEEERISSVQRLALVVKTGVSFLDAYAAGDKRALAGVCTEKFFVGSLNPADLSTVALPDAHIHAAGYKTKIQGARADFIIPTSNEILKIGLVRKDYEDPDIPSRYLVEDVTMYELDGSQEKRLAAMFTGHARMLIFADALADRNLPLLKASSTADFTQRVWGRLTDETIRELPLADIEDATPVTLSTVFHGAVTELTVRQGETALTYLLRDVEGQLRVDDILMPVHNRPNSLKATLELMIPIDNFARAIYASNLDGLQRSSSQEFNRQVWHQTSVLPDIGFDIPSHLRAPLRGVHEIEGQPDTLLVTLGDDSWGAQITMMQERSQYVIDEILLIAGPEPRQRARLKHTLRVQLSFGIRQAETAIRRPQTVEEASFDQPAPAAAPAHRDPPVNAAKRQFAADPFVDAGY